MKEENDYEMRRQIDAPVGHPREGKQISLYRLKAEEQIGRYLKPGEIVHHHYKIDGTYDLIVCKNLGEHRKLDIISRKNLETYGKTLALKRSLRYKIKKLENDNFDLND